jgi:hypothetical protein
MNEEKKNEGVEKTVCIDMFKISKELGFEGWTTYEPDDIYRCIDAVKAKIPAGYRRVQLIGTMPNIVAMAVTAALYPMVSKLEYGEYRGPRHTVFYEEECESCPEMAL